MKSKRCIFSPFHHLPNPKFMAIDRFAFFPGYSFSLRVEMPRLAFLFS
jgi:hypothetical protein